MKKTLTFPHTKHPTSIDPRTRSDQAATNGESDPERIITMGINTKVSEQVSECLSLFLSRINSISWFNLEIIPSNIIIIMLIIDRRADE